MGSSPMQRYWANFVGSLLWRVLWLSGRFDNVVDAIDTSTGEVKSIPVGRQPSGLTVWPQPGRYSLGHTGRMRKRWPYWAKVGVDCGSKTTSTLVCATSVLPPTADIRRCSWNVRKVPERKSHAWIPRRVRALRRGFAAWPRRPDRTSQESRERWPLSPLPRSDPASDARRYNVRWPERRSTSASRRCLS